MNIIETRGLRKSFRTRTGVVEAVRGIDLDVREGEIFGLLGPNGAGKSTTMRMLATLLPPDDGEARVVGFDLRREPGRVRERIGYVSQAGGVEDSATGYENLLLQAQLYGMTRRAAQARAAELAAALELDSFASRLARGCSGGQRRRLDLAMGMVHRPALLFLDEPTTGLDPQSRARLWDEVRALRAGGTTVFLTTHYLDEADALADRLAIVDGGQVVAQGTPSELKRQVAGDVITLGLDAAHDALAHAEAILRAQPFVRQLRADGGTLHLYVERGEEALPQVIRLLDMPLQTVTLARPSLDDVFLRMTGRSLRESA